ncbi:MAG: hypothetical protein N2378_14600 [Chloroflexaceae bacterium]|nr:hypothetical protein [Chloroflexaceae bacterium]
MISPELLQLRFIERWNGILPRFMSGDSGLLPLINIPASELEETPAATPPAPATAPAGQPVSP